MQRLHPEDLCGYLLDKNEEPWEVVDIPAIQDGKALWPYKHTLEDLKSMKRANPTVFERQYMQNPVPREGMLYTKFYTYTELPTSGALKVKGYVDTADTGEDYLCSIIYLAHNALFYLLDVVYTQKPMEITERLVSAQIERTDCKKVDIESNNGGRGFARNVERNVKEGNIICTVDWFHQSQNKQARIFNESANVQNFIRYPEGWQSKWPEFSDAIRRYTSKGKNKHDDAPDVLTGIIEKNRVGKRKFIFE